MKITTTQHIRIEFDDGSVKELSAQAQVLAETHTPYQLATKYLLAQEEALNMQDLIAFLEKMIPNLDEMIERYEEKNQ